MYYCNDFIGKNILSLFEGDLLGKVDKLRFDKKLKKLICLEVLTENDTNLILPTTNIFHLGKNAITIRNNQAVSLIMEQPDSLVCPIGNKVYSITGEYLGKVKEIDINEKYFTQNVLLDNNMILPITQLASCGKTTLIFNEQNKKLNLQKFTPTSSPKLAKSEQVSTAQIMPISNNPMVETPNITTQTDDFILGKICHKNIYNFNNEVLVKANSKIDKKILKEVKKYGKLRELMLFSK